MRSLILGALLVALAFLTGCAGLTPSGGSPASAGAPQPATNLAQTARDQAAVPGQAYGGHNNWHFASTGQVEVQAKLLEMAAAQSWTPDAIQKALAATNGAPETVTITVTGNVQGGNADNAGAGTSGAGSAAGSGSVGSR